MTNHQVSEANKARVPEKELFCLIVILWLGLVIAGYSLLLSYERSRGPVTQSPVRWPVDTCIQRPAGCFTLVLFAHPKCPCTAATLSELALLMTHCRQLKARVLFLKPASLSEGWERGPSRDRAIAIPGVTVASDECGKEAARFNARTSGEVVVYDPAGNLVFHGGITAGRGHEGDNQGLDAIESIVRNGYSACRQTPVFGCSLSDKSSPDSD